jgi:hypothetical protein
MYDNVEKRKECFKTYRVSTAPNIFDFLWQVEAGPDAPLRPMFLYLKLKHILFNLSNLTFCIFLEVKRHLIKCI